MNATNVFKTLVTAINGRKRILLTGPPAVGKTSLVKQAQKATGAKLSTFYVSISDPTDFKGIPCIIDGVACFKPFDELDAIFNANELHIIFLDDFGQGTNATQAATMSFMDRLKDNPNVCIIGATNRREDRANVSGILEPVKSRFDSIVQFEFSMPDFLDWSIDQYDAGKMPLSLIAFNKFRPALMYGTKPSQDLVNMACPRTVAALGELMLMDFETECQFELYAGCVGVEYTTELMGFLPIWDKLPNIDTILINPESVKLPDISEQYATSIYFAVCNAVCRKATQNNFDRILKFSERLPVDFAVSLIADCIKFCPDVQETAGYMKWLQVNKNYIL